MNEDSIFTPQRIMLGFAASSLVIMAGCLSGLPAVTCTALAQTYAIAISGLGVNALIFLGCLVPIEVVSRLQPNSKVARGIITVVFVSIGIVGFTGQGLSDVDNMAHAVIQCYGGPAAEHESRTHSSMKEIVGPLDYETWRAFIAPFLPSFLSNK